MQLAELLTALEAEGTAHDAEQSEHGRKRLNLEPETARLLHLLILASKRRRVLEIGTSNGYSALWIVQALQAVAEAQPLISLERDASKAAQARKNLAGVGWAGWLDSRVGDATKIVATLDGPFDAVFFDADRISAPEQLALLLPKLAADAMLIADNALSHPGEIAGYLDAVSKLPGFTSMVIPVGKGLHVAYRTAGG